MRTYVLVHGAFHGEWMWAKITPLLQEMGHRVITLDLPGHGEDQTAPSHVTLKDYTDRVCDILAAEPEPVILVGHSMGGLVITQAAEYYPDKIKTLVYLAAILPQNGESLLQINQNDKHALPLHVAVSEDQTYLQLDTTTIKENFYGDCSDDDVLLAQEKLCRQPLAPFITPVHLTAERFGRLPRIYIETSKDKAISAEFQRELYTNTPCQQVMTIDSDHSPFFSQPERMVSLLSRLSENGGEVA